MDSLDGSEQGWEVNSRVGAGAIQPCPQPGGYGSEIKDF